MQPPTRGVTLKGKKTGPRPQDLRAQGPGPGPGPIYPSLLSAYTLHSYQHIPLTPISIYPSLLSAYTLGSPVRRLGGSPAISTGSNLRFEPATPEKCPRLPVRTRGSNRCHRFAGSPHYATYTFGTRLGFHRSEGFPLTAYLGPWACCRTRPGEFRKLVP